jgi:hypothetical protein
MLSFQLDELLPGGIQAGIAVSDRLGLDHAVGPIFNRPGNPRHGKALLFFAEVLPL